MGAHSAAPTRATNNITLAFGLVAVPIQLFKATDDTKPVDRKQFHRTTGNPIGTQNIDKITGKVAASEDVVLKAPVDDKWVELSDDEIAVATTGLDVNKHDIPIDAFVPLSAIGDTYLVDTARLYQARPTPMEVKRRKVDNPIANKAYALLMAVLAKKQAGALFHVGLRSTARYAVLMPDGMVRFLFFDGEIREQRATPDVEISDGEMNMALMLVGEELETPELVDDAKAKIAEFLETKAKDVTATPVVTEAPTPSVLDLTAALAASVEAATKKKAA